MISKPFLPFARPLGPISGLGAALLCVAACGGGQPRSDSGVAVGNPGSMRASAGREAEVSVARLSLSAKQTLLDPCEDAPRGQGRAALGPTAAWGQAGEPVPAGSWCAIELRSVSLEVEGVAPANAFTLAAKVGALRVELDEALPLDAGPLLLVLGGEGWLGAAALDNGGEPLVLRPNDPLAEQLAAALARSTLFVDRDADGELSAGDASVAAAVGMAASDRLELPPLANGHALDAHPAEEPDPGLLEGPAVVLAAGEAEAGRGVIEGEVPADAAAALDTGAPPELGPDEHPEAGDDAPATDRPPGCDDDDDEHDGRDDDDDCDDSARADEAETDGA